MAETKNILVALDRDGTIIYDDEGYFGRSDNWKENIRFYKGIFEAIKILNNFSRVIITSNQIGIAYGLYSSERVGEINRHLDGLIKEKGALIDAWYFCPYVERSWAEKNKLNLNSPWISESFPETRKPNIGMLESAAFDFKTPLSFYKKIFVIGDSLDDLNMALNVNGAGIFFNNGRNNHLNNQVKFLESANPGKIFSVNSLLSGAEIIEKFHACRQVGKNQR